jgi:hypothetical protein
MRILNKLRVSRPEEVKLEALRYRYPTRSAVTMEAELAQIERCVSLKFPRLSLRPIREETASIVGYGPSLAETWDQVTWPIFTVSGAHDFLVERGKIPDWHVECDGRDHKTKHLTKPRLETAYLIASICNPRVWEQLRGFNVEYWHNCNGQHVVDWIGKNDDGSILVAGGSVVGLTAIHIAGILGFRKFKLFGFDGNFWKGSRHAGPHYGPPQKVIERNGWQTSPQMSNACDELLWLMKNEELQIEVVGHSLMKSLV